MFLSSKLFLKGSIRFVAQYGLKTIGTRHGTNFLNCMSTNTLSYSIVPSVLPIGGKVLKRKQTPSLPIVSKDDVKQMSTAEICLYLKAKKAHSYDVHPLVFELVEREDVFVEEVELAIRALYRYQRYASVNRFLQIISEKHTNVSLSTTTIKMMFESMISSKDYTLVDTLWRCCSKSDKHRWHIIGVYTRALLGAKRLEDAQEFITLMKSNPYEVLVADSNIVQGLYEGGFYEKCISYYNSITSSNKVLTLWDDPRGYFAIVLAAYKQKDYHLILSVYSIIRTLKTFPNRDVVYVLTEVFTNGDFWRLQYDKQIQSWQHDEYEITESLLVRLLAKCRLPQFSSGGKIIGEFSQRSKETQIIVNTCGNLEVTLKTYSENQRKLLLYYYLEKVGEKCLDGSYYRESLLVKTVQNDSVLIDLLRKELYPTVFVTDLGDSLSIPVSAIIAWYRYKDVNL